MSQRILVVDDDEATRRVVVRLLTRAGLDVASCSGGAEALTLLAASPFDAMVTDLVMRGIGGLELVTQARARFPALRCVVMSGQCEPAEGVAGAAWVDKPIRVEALLAALAPG